MDVRDGFVPPAQPQGPRERVLCALPNVLSPQVQLPRVGGGKPAQFVVDPRFEPLPHGDFRLARAFVRLPVGEHPPVEKGDNVCGLYQAACMARGEVESVHDPGEPATSVGGRSDVSVAGQVGAMLGLPVHLVRYDQGVLAERGHTFVHSFEQMLQYHRMRWFGKAVPRVLTHHVHRPRDHVDVLCRNGLDDIVEHTDPRTYRDTFPCAAGVEYLVSVQLHAMRHPYAFEAATTTRSNSS